MIQKASIEDVISVSWTAYNDKKNRLYLNYEPSLRQGTLLSKYLREDLDYFVIKTPYRASAGMQILNESVTLGLVRSYVFQDFKSQWYLSKLLEYQIEVYKTKKLWITFNECTSSIYKHVLFPKSRVLPKVWYSLTPIGIKTINYTEQYVLEYDRRT